jgi:hypothetical protein
MKVKLINVAEYNIKDDKVSEIPYESFVNLCGGVGKIDENDKKNLPSVRLFKTVGEFACLTEEEIDTIDTNENIRLLQNGQFLVFLKGWNKEENNTTIETYAATDTKENKGE